jgi:septal ring factor EnvC (AmiA/AmiB activator)
MTPMLWKAGSTASLGALLGLIVYHFVIVGGLKADIASKESAIRTLTAEKATLNAENVVLRQANDRFAKLTREQNSALQTLRRERDDAVKAWQAEVAAGAQRSVEFRRRIAELQAVRQEDGEPWYDTWKRMLDLYFAKR